MVPVAAGVGAYLGCDALTAGSGSVACIAAGAAAFGYVYNAVDTHTAFSVANLKSAADYGAFAGCLVASALSCAFMAGGASVADYAATGHYTHQWGGRNLGLLRINLGLDFIGWRIGTFFEDGAKAAQQLREVGQVQVSFAGGTRLPLSEVEPGMFGFAMRVAGRLGQTGVTNLIRIANYDYGTMTCANPAQRPGYCP